MSLKRNIASLQVLQISSFLIPLIVQPWLARVLGPGDYGRYNFVLAVVAYFLLLVDFGFTWSATRSLAVHRDNRRKRSEVVCVTYVTKAAMAFIGIIVLTMIILVSSQIRTDVWLFLTAYLGVIGAVLAPNWYFQGIEKPHFSSIVDILTRMISVPLMLVLVRSPADLFRAILISSTTQLLIGVFGVAMLLRRREISWVMPNVRDVGQHLRMGFPLFMSTSAVSLYTTTNSVILAVIASREQLAYFSAAQKIIAVASAIFVPINQAVYPRVSYQFGQKSQDVFKLLKKIFWINGAIGTVIAVALLMFAYPLMTMLFGDAYQQAGNVLRWLAPIPALLGLSSVFANLILLPLGQDKKHIVMVVGAAIVSLIAIVPLVRAFGSNGAAMTLLIAESVVFLYSGFQAAKLVNAPDFRAQYDR